jgi:hypothetical protein
MMANIKIQRAGPEWIAQFLGILSAADLER